VGAEKLQKCHSESFGRLRIKFREGSGRIGKFKLARVSGKILRRIAAQNDTRKSFSASCQ